MTNDYSIIIRKMNMFIKQFNQIIDSTLDDSQKETFKNNYGYDIYIKEYSCDKNLFQFITENRISSEKKKYILEENYADYFRFMSKNLSEDSNYIKQLLKIDGSILPYMAEEIQNNPILNLLALENDHSKFQTSILGMKKEIKENAEVAIKYIERLYERCNLKEINNHVFKKDYLDETTIKWLENEKFLNEVIDIDAKFIEHLPLNYLSTNLCIFAADKMIESYSSEENYLEITEKDLDNVNYLLQTTYNKDKEVQKEK